MPDGRSQAGGVLALAAIVLSAAVFAAVAGASAGNLDILWDEAVDLQIAAALAEHPIVGEGRAVDPSQFRLPMYVTALASKLSGRSSLAAAREVSVGVGVVGILAAAGLAWTLFGRATGALAAALLALSPYYLAFGRIAMTEGDVFVAATVALTCWAFAAYLSRPTTWRWALTGILLGAAVGAKAYSIVLAPIFWLCLAGWAWPADGKEVRRQRLWGTLVVSALALVLAVIVVQIMPDWAVAVWAAVWVLLLSTLGAVRLDGIGGLGRGRGLAGIFIVAALTWAAAMPEHLTQPHILRGLVGRAANWDHKPPLAMALDHLRLYSGIVLFKATIPVGVLSAVGLLVGLARCRTDPRWRIPTLGVLGWVAALCFLPLRQTFYLMGVYPLLMVLTAAFALGLVGWVAGRGRGRLALASVLFVAGPLAWLAEQAWAAYPDYQLYPDRLFAPGFRWLGAEVRGYRNLIQTNSDGVETLLRWCLVEVPAGSRVVSYLWEDHILDRDLPDGLPFTLIRRAISQDSAAVPPPPSIADADFVLLHINNLLGYGDLPPDVPPLAELERDFERAAVIRRGMSPIEVGWVFERRGGNRQKY